MSRTQQFWHLNRFWNVVGTRLPQKIVHNELSCDGCTASRWELRERLGCSAAEYPDRAQCSCKLEVFQLDSWSVSPPLNVEWTGVKICMTVTDHTDSNLRILDALRFPLKEEWAVFFLENVTLTLLILMQRYCIIAGLLLVTWCVLFYFLGDWQVLWTPLWFADNLG